MTFDKNKHLREVLDTHKMHHVQEFVDKVKNRREEIKVKMHDHYGSDKYSSFGSGSFAKHTATNVKFDLDLVEPFKHSAFDTLQASLSANRRFPLAYAFRLRKETTNPWNWTLCPGAS